MSFVMVVMLITLLPFPIVVGVLALEEIRADREHSSHPRRSPLSRPASDV
ncbi:MAG: hypothetical protein Q7U39_03475 [Nitrospira sp.]|nr:hypothetical protein [Nitrospira sp.]